MTTVSGDITIRVGGFGSGADTYEFCLYGTPTTTRFPVLLEPPRLPPASLPVLDPSSSSSSISFRLAYEASSVSTAARDAVRELIACDVLPFADGSGGYVKTTRTVAYTETAIPVTATTGISDGDYICVLSEVMQVNGSPTSTSIPVVRAQRGTVARNLPSFRGDGVAVYPSVPQATGQPVEVERDGTVLWRGFVDSVEERDGTHVTVTARSLMQSLRDRVREAPTGFGFDRRGASYDIDAYGGQWEVPDNQPTFLVDCDLYGDPAESSSFEWSAARLTDSESGRSIAVPVTYVFTAADTDAQGREYKVAVYALNLTAGSVLTVYQSAENGALVDFGGAWQERRKHYQRVLNQAPPGGIEIAYYDRVTSGANLQTILDRLLGQSAIRGITVGFPSAWFSTALVSRVNSEARIAVLRNEQHDDTASSHGLASESDRFAQYIEDHYTGPLFHALAESGGVLRVVDWAPGDTFTSATLTAADTRGGHAYTRRGSDALTSVVMRFGTVSYRIDPRRVRVSELGTKAQQRYARKYLNKRKTTVDYLVGKTDVHVEVSPWASIGDLESGAVEIGIANARTSQRTPYRRRVAEVVALYGRPLPSLSLELLPTSTALSIGIGDVVAVTRTDIPDPDGSRGATAERGLVYRYGVDLQSGAVSIALVMIDAFRGSLDFGRYCPSGEVTAWSGSTLTIAANAFTAAGVDSPLPDRDIEGFALAFAAQGSPLEIALYDSSGALRQYGDVTAVTEGANTMTVNWRSMVTPVAGDIVSVSDSADNTTLRTAAVSATIGDRFAFLGDSSGDDAGGNDVAQYR